MVGALSDSGLGFGVGVAATGGFGFALRLPAGAQWVTTENGTKYVTITDNGVVKRLYKFGTFDFTPVDIDTSAAIGALAGTFDVSSPGGYPVTLTTTDPNFSISGASLLVAAPLQPVRYYVQVKATDANGWKWPKLFMIDVDAAVVLQDVTFSKPLYQGVELNGVVIEDVAVGATVALNIAGITADHSVRPVTVSGTPQFAGIVANAIVQTLGAASKANSCTVGAGVPVNTSLPLADTVPQVGVPWGRLPVGGAVLGPDDGTFTNNPNSRSVQTMLVATGTGNGVAIPPAQGGAQPQYIPQESDVGKRLRRRIRAFNPAGGSLSPGTYSDLSPVVIAAASAQPVNTTAPSLSSSMGAHSGLDDVITASPGIWTGASGGVVGSFYADNEPVAGETPLTFRRTMLTLTAVITYREVATGPIVGSAASQATATSNAIVGDPGLKTWPLALFDPEERIDMRTGTLNLTYDADRDYLCVAGTHVTGDVRTGPLKTSGGRRRWLVGQNMGAKQISSVGGQHVTFMGIAHNAYDAPETDGLAMGGTSLLPDDVLILACRFEGNWGTRNWYKYFGQQNKANIASFARTGPNEFMLELASPLPEPITAGQTFHKDRKMRITGLPGYAPLTGLNYDYEVVEALTPTKFRLKRTTLGAAMWDELARPDVGASYTSGVAWFMGQTATAPGGYLDNAEHPDTAGQQDRTLLVGRMVWERVTAVTAYQAIRISDAVTSYPSPQILDSNFRHFTNRDPQEPAVQLFFSGIIKSLKLENAWFAARFGLSAARWCIGISGIEGNPVTSNEIDGSWTTTTVNGQKRITNPFVQGYGVDGSPEVDFCQRTGGAFAMPTFLGYAGPDLSRFTDVTLEKGSGGPVAPGILDRIVVDYDGPEIISISISGIDPSILYKGPGRRILAGPAFVAGTAYTFTVNLTPRGSALTKSQAVTRGA